MDRKFLRNSAYNAVCDLTLENDLYKQWVFRYTFLELHKDLEPNGDITTSALFNNTRRSTFDVIAKEPGILAGVQEIRYFLVDSDKKFRPNLFGSFDVDFFYDDGDPFNAGDRILSISGFTNDILAIERCSLNLLSRMSGVATFASRINDLVDGYDVLVVPTRKTLWGLLDKRACTLGGCGTHRLNLSDAVIVKDNHLDLLDRDFGKVLQKIVDAGLTCRFFEFEVESCDEALRVAEAIYQVQKVPLFNNPPVIMFDNLNAVEISSAILKLKEYGLFETILFEASGGITDKNVLDYAKTGVDIISMGILTNGVSGIDFSMRIH